jgi:hypothetical protein
MVADKGAQYAPAHCCANDKRDPRPHGDKFAEPLEPRRDLSLRRRSAAVRWLQSTPLVTARQTFCGSCVLVCVNRFLDYPITLEFVVFSVALESANLICSAVPMYLLRTTDVINNT